MYFPRLQAPRTKTEEEEEGTRNPSAHTGMGKYENERINSTLQMDLSGVFPTEDLQDEELIDGDPFA